MFTGEAQKFQGGNLRPTEHGVQFHIYDKLPHPKHMFWQVRTIFTVSLYIFLRRPWPVSISNAYLQHAKWPVLKQLWKDVYRLESYPMAKGRKLLTAHNFTITAYYIVFSEDREPKERGFYINEFLDRILVAV